MPHWMHQMGPDNAWRERALKAEARVRDLERVLGEARDHLVADEPQPWGEQMTLSDARD
jgi:hypothetical protein